MVERIAAAANGRRILFSSTVTGNQRSFTLKHYWAQLVLTSSASRAVLFGCVRCPSRTSAVLQGGVGSAPPHSALSARQRLVARLVSSPDMPGAAVLRRLRRRFANNTVDSRIMTGSYGGLVIARYRITDRED